MEIEIPLFQELSLKFIDAPRGTKDYATGGLQKGFLLLDHGQELAEEAVGFGVPVLKKGLQTVFPGSATLSCRQTGTTWIITAVFKLNLVEKISQDGEGNLENGTLYSVKYILAAAIRRFPLSRALLTEISSILRRLFRWETTYADAGFSIDIKVLYTVDTQSGTLTAEFDTQGLPSSITEVIVMNEQGAHYFDQYADTSRISLQGSKIGFWDEVNAKEAWFESSSHRLAFQLSQVKNARLFRGRELIGSRLAWSGFGYSFPPSIGKFRYEVRIEKIA